VGALATKALPKADDLFPEEEDAALQAVIERAYRRILIEMHHLVADALPIDPARFRLDDAATRAILEHAATRVVGISETTRQAIAEQLVAGQAAGLSTTEIMANIEHLFSVTWARRAETVARTEIAEAQRVSAIDRYTASGLVDRVTIRDGEDDEPCAGRNGTTVPIGRAPELAHPNCTLILIPVLREGAG
jgi:hypothetical protein